MYQLDSDTLSSPSDSEIDEDAVVFFCYTGGKPEDIPRNVTHIQVDPSVEGLQNGAFQALLHLIEVTFNTAEVNRSNLRRIGPRVFFSCKALTRIVIPELVRSISNSTFSRCDKLKHVSFPEGLVEIGSDAFFGCVSLAMVELPSTLLRIGPSAFKGCKLLQEVNLPLSLKEIEFAAFQECVLLQEIAIPPLVNTIVNNTFDHCLGLKMVKLSEGIRIIDTYAFRYCFCLRSIAIPSTMYKIGRGAFADCHSLETVEFAEGNLRILNGLAFADCNNLFHVALPSTINTLYSNSFQGCTKLEQLRRPNPHENLPEFLVNRFAHVPIHEVCYRNVHVPLSNTLQNLEAIEDHFFEDYKSFDFLGMTPLHIVAASSRPEQVLFAKLLPRFSKHLWSHKDFANTTPMDYLLRNPAPESVPSIRYILRTVLKDRLAALGLGEWRFEVESMIDSLSSEDELERRKPFIDMLQHFRILEQKEGSSILEQVVWKIQLAGMALESEKGNGEEYNALRESRRINCGAEIVIPNVLPFLGEMTIDLFGF